MPDERKSKVVPIRLTESEYERFRQVCEALGRSASEWGRTAVMASVERHEQTK